MLNGKPTSEGDSEEHTGIGGDRHGVFAEKEMKDK